MKAVEIAPLPSHRLGALIGPDRYAPLLEFAAQIRERLGDGVVWNINATATGGGVAEMLQTMLAYANGLGITAQWRVLEGDAEFFAITKRIHNLMHGSPGDGGPLGEAEQAHYREVLRRNVEDFLRELRPSDVVLLHDPQTAGMAEALKAAGVPVIFRSHIGKDEPDEFTARAWEFLRPHLAHVDAIVVSRPTYAPPFADPATVTVIPPSIDPFSAKNIDIPQDRVCAVLAHVGVITGSADPEAVAFTRRDGSPGVVRAHDDLFAAGSTIPADAPYVLQVSRWDRLKDMPGVLTAFTDHVSGHDQTHLLLVGPATAGVSDDPEGAEVLAECVEQWQALPPALQRRVHLIEVPMDDIDENAFIVNALQHGATAVVQKSLMEGFGLTVAEAMWKRRPVLASRVGGIQDQVEDGVSGLLLDDPADLAGLGALIQRVLDDPAHAAGLGAAARLRVCDRFLGDRHLMQYGRLIEPFLPH